MADISSTDQLMSGDIKDPPAKRPCLDMASNGLGVGGDPPVDEGSDFYNTPLNAGTPVHTAQNGRAEDNNSVVPPTPPKPAPAIPGLSFLYKAEAATESQAAGVSDHGSAVQQTSSLDKPSELDTPQKLAKQVLDPEDVEMGATNPVIQQSEGEQLGQNHTATEESKNAAPVVSEVNNEPMPPAQNGVPGESPRRANHNGGTEIGPDNSENPEWEMDSSPYESSSSDSSSDDSDDDDDSSGEYDLLDPEEQARILMAAEGGSDDEGDGKNKAAHVRTANEKPEEIVPKPDITITPDMKVELLGNVETIVENVILIKANISGEYQVLESGSVLCLADLSVIGMVSETLGRVEQPLYTVRFPNEESIKEAKLEKGTPVFYVVDHSTFVFTQPLKGLKGSDASNFHDEEVGDEEIEFSDDEAEAEYKRQLKQKRQQKKDGRRDASGPGRPRRDRPGPSGLGSYQVNYDDINTEDGYTPLSRPKNFHEMIGNSEAPTEESQPRNQFAERHSRGGRGRGRGRGSDRGGRGRGRGGSYQKHGDDHQRPQQQQHQPEQPQSRQQETSQHTYPPQSAEFRPPQAFYQTQNPYQQQPSPYNSPSYPPYQTAQQNQPAQMYNTNQAFFPSGFPPAQQQFPFQPLHQPQSVSPYPPPGSHINPAFFHNLQQHQQQQQQSQHNSRSQPAEQTQQSLQGTHSGQAATTQSSVDTFAAAQAQLDLLRRLSRGGS
ncbi:H/ACA ribonucleoprotein complex non-core subunit NAF1 [Blastomyces parvus]|uniref:H/ACA ribonucleoprotein complex non-core subunit NAF1 n=1 Tax=Blastomyces parvus TaxID=2060905 RepID=A0A2B7WHG3_9EURO|nr:H/ACA ribonucleoprotein complex non-core subunit NAF1 [Blastomyces parvus]